MTQTIDPVHEYIRRIELFTRRLLSGALIGSSRSAQKGIGLDFDQLRDYAIGDDPRIIDWTGYARTQRLLVKQYQEERNRTIVILIDGSSSMQFGLEHKGERAHWIAGIIGMIGAYGTDKVGLIIYTDMVELHVPPRAGVSHVHTLIRALYTHKSHATRTDIRPALKIVGALKERSLVFVLSDCIDGHLAHALRTMRRHDVILISCADEREQVLPATGICIMHDCESSNSQALYIHKNQARALHTELENRNLALETALKSTGVTVITSVYKESFIRDLLLTMRRRMRY